MKKGLCLYEYHQTKGKQIQSHNVKAYTHAQRITKEDAKITSLQIKGTCWKPWSLPEARTHSSFINSDAVPY